MRISKQEAQQIKAFVVELLGDTAKVWLFGSRADDDKKGGDLDLLIKVEEPIARPAFLSSQLGVPLMRLFKGRKVDIVLEAPNLEIKPIHGIEKKWY
jgi:predicted nucleotidyltransferase